MVGGASSEVGKGGLRSGLTQDAVQLCAADRADSLGHASAVGLVHLSGEIALLFALHAVGVAGVALGHRGVLLLIGGAADPLRGHGGRG